VQALKREIKSGKIVIKAAIHQQFETLFFELVFSTCARTLRLNF